MTKIWLTPWSNLLKKCIVNLWLILDQVFLVKVLSACTCNTSYRVLYSILGPDLLGLTVALWNIVGRCFSAVCRGLNHRRYSKSNWTYCCWIRALNVNFSIFCVLLYHTSLTFSFQTLYQSCLIGSTKFGSVICTRLYLNHIPCILTYLCCTDNCQRTYFWPKTIFLLFDLGLIQN